MANITGTAGNDTLVGTSQSDIIDGLGGLDEIHGGVGNDVIDGGAGNDTLYGDSQSDTLEGGAGNDTLDGGDGSDTLSGGAGNDILNGGVGGSAMAPDTASYATATNLVKVSLALQGVEQSTIGGGFDTLLNIENLIGSNFNDTLTGDEGSNRLTGGLGNDILTGAGGDDFLVGGAGNDTLNGGDGADRALYSAAAAGVTIDLNIQGVAQNTGGDGVDTLIGVEGVTGSAFDDVLTGTAGANIIYGGGGNDVITAGDGDDQIGGGLGDDVLDGGAGTDTLDLYVTFTNPPNLTVDLRIKGVAQDTGGGLKTLIGIENVIGGYGDDTITGDANDNIIDGYDGNDTLDGGAGTDTLSFALDQSGEWFTIDLEEGVASGFFYDSVDHFSNFENVIGSNDRDYISGNAGDNVLNGGDGDDVLTGRDGDDLLIGGRGDDWMDGGEGMDTVSYADATSGVLAGLFIEQQSQVGWGNWDTLINIENLVGSAHEDTLLGNDKVNSLSGGLGDDWLAGLGGNDAINGGEGEDTAAYEGNRADYQLTLLDGVVTVIDLRDPGAEHHDGVDTLVGIEKLKFADGVFNIADLHLGPPEPVDDELVVTRGVEASLSADVLLVNDRVGSDLLVTAVTNIVGAQVALVDGRLVILAAGETASFDYVIGAGENAITGHATIRTVVATAAADTLTGAPSNIADLHGLNGNDILTGTDGDDRLFGDGGNDTLQGGAGADFMVGGAGNDIFHVDNALDIVVELAGGGRDTIISSVDYVLGAEIEVLTLTGDAREGTGNALANTITGTSGDDTLDGAAGADIMVGGLGDDIYYVDDAGDRVTEATNAGYDEVITTLNSYVLANNVETLRFAGTGAFTGKGNSVANAIWGGEGDDILDGGAGNDLLRGGAGDDYLYGSGADTLLGGLGDDTYVVSGAGVFILEQAGEGYDRVETSVSLFLELISPEYQAIEELVATGTASITLQGNLATRRIIGNDGNNQLWSFGTGVYLAGGKGDDTYYTSTGSILVEAAGEGYDTVVAGNHTLADNFEKLIISPNAPLALTGTGNSVDNVIIGNEYDNVIDGKAGADRMEGGLGDDTYYVDNLGDVVKETGVGIDLVISSVDFTLGVALENLTITGSVGRTGKGNALANIIIGGDGGDLLSGGVGNDTLQGGGGDDTLSGEIGDDLLYGGDGDDTLDGGVGVDLLNGGVGADKMTGGLGNDTYVVDNAGDVLVETSTGGVDLVRLTATSFTLGDYIDNLIAEWASAGVATGNSLANTMTGNLLGGAFYGLGGADRLIGVGGASMLLDGGEGNDILQSGSSLDVLVGGAGNDTFIIKGGETVTEFAAGGTDTVELVAAMYGFALAANVENLRYSAEGQSFNGSGNGLNNVITMLNSGSDVVRGLDGDDTIRGGDGDDILYGDAGNDKLYGESGSDRLLGGSGNDIYYIDYHADSLDRIDEAYGEGIDTVQLNQTTGYILDSNVENLTYVGDYSMTGASYLLLGGNELNNTIRGSYGGDRLYGLGGNDTLFGGAGDDRITGEAGVDRMTGGAGADIFIYESVTDSGIGGTRRDIIVDFDKDDRLDFTAIDANPLLGGDQAFTFLGTAVFDGAAGQIRYVIDAAGTHVFGDVNGDGVADFEVLLLGAVNLNAGDFLL